MKMQKNRKGYFFAILFILFLTYGLQQNAMASQEYFEKGEKLITELKDLRTDIESSCKFKFFGFTHQQFSYDKTKGDNHGSDYSSVRFRLGIIGNPSEKWDYFILTEWGRLTQYDPVTLLDAYIEYKYSPSLKIKLGQTWYKFSWDGTRPLPDNPFVIRPKVIDSIWLPMGRTGSYSYDKGIEISGEKEINKKTLGYIFSVTTGNGIDDHHFDDNNKKDLCARIYFKPNSNLQIGASGFYGYSRTSATSSSGATKTVDLPENAYGFEFRYQNEKFRCEAEYLKGHYDEYSGVENGITYSLAKETPRGYYIMGGFLLTDWLELLVRYDYYEKNASLIDTGLETTTLGINFYFDKNNKRNKFMLNYLFRNPEENYGSTLDDLFIAQLQLMF
jgi:hypothetical protein